MLTREEIKCKLDSYLVELGSAKLNALRFDEEFSYEPFTIFKIKRYNRIIHENYIYCQAGLDETEILQIINTNLYE